MPETIPPPVCDISDALLRANAALLLLDAERTLESLARLGMREHTYFRLVEAQADRFRSILGWEGAGACSR